MASSFRLSDAQELIARQAAFESWDVLRKGLQTMKNSDRRRLSRPVLLAAEPQLYVADVTASCDFYTKMLGFEVAFTYGDPPFYGQVARDGAHLNLRWVPSPLIDTTLRDKEGLLAASIVLEDAKPLYLEFEAAGVPFHETLRTQPWGARTFVVRDPDGNLILFAGKDE